MTANNNSTTESEANGRDTEEKNSTTGDTTTDLSEQKELLTTQETDSMIQSRASLIPARLSFPCKLYNMLEDADEKGFRHIVSWNTEGKGFTVHDSAGFLKHVIPLYFSNQTKYKSFQRQLSLYGFTRITSGRAKGLRYHKDFIRGSKQRCKQMKPVATTTTKTMKSIVCDQKEQQEGQKQMGITSSLPVAPRTYCVTSIKVEGDTGSVASEQPCSVSILPEELKSSHSIPLKDYGCITLHEKPKHLNEHHEKHPVVTSSMVRVVTADSFPLQLNESNRKEDVGFFEGKSFYLMNNNINSNKPLQGKLHPKQPRPLYQPRLYAPPKQTASAASTSMPETAHKQTFQLALPAPVLPVTISPPESQESHYLFI